MPWKAVSAPVVKRSCSSSSLGAVARRGVTSPAAKNAWGSEAKANPAADST